MTLAPAIAARGACTDPSVLPIVDAAFARPKSPAQSYLEEHVCPGCPIWEECLRDALDNGEHGPWGGTNERRRRRTVKRSDTFNLRNIHDRVTGQRHYPETRANIALLRELGVTAGEVKRWAVEAGHLATLSNAAPSLELVQAYAAAHDARSA